MKYVGYVRVSTSEQVNDSQINMINDYLKASNGDELISLYQEKESGSKGDRTELKKAMNEAINNNAILLIAKLDRLSRNVAFISTLMESKVDFRICDMPTADKFTIHIYAAIAEKELEQIRNRTKAGLSAIKRNIERDGYYISKAGNKITHLGKDNMTDEIRLKALKGIADKKANNPNLIKAKALAISLKTGGLDNLSKIAEVLNENGFKTSRGGMFKAEQVKRLFK